MELARLLAVAIFLTQGLSTPVAASDEAEIQPPSRDDAPQGVAAAVEPTVLQPTLTIRPTPPIRACTTTIYEKGVNPCTRLNGVQTMYPSTTTQYEMVDCHGCFQVSVVKDIYYCPMEVVTSRLTIHTPSTSTVTICGPTTEPGPRGRLARMAAPEPTAAPALDLARKDAVACPTTFVVQPDKSAGSMATEYQQWSTSTVLLNCGGCPLSLSTVLAGYGPAGRFTETTTIPIGTTTAYACQ